MIKARFKGEPTEEQKRTEVVAAQCKCGRCTRTGESSDSSMASSDLN